jgi:tetratricopeptide (TPR) repeat protein
MKLKYLLVWLGAYSIAMPLCACEHEAGLDPSTSLLRATFAPIEAGRFVNPLHQSISTTNSRAQNLYDQGLSFFSGYSWLDAARSFRRALDLDPDQPMALLGLANALRQLGLTSAAAETFDLIQVSADPKRLTPIENELLRLGRLEFNLFGDPKQIPADAGLHFRQALDSTLSRFPKDPYLLVLRGHSEAPSPEGIGRNAAPKALTYYYRALELSPDNWAAHHFLAHAHENRGDFTRALSHALAFRSAAPELPHAWHMQAHVLPRLGRWPEARNALVHAHLLHQRAPNDLNLDWHYGHNLRLLATLCFLIGDPAGEQYFRGTWQLTYEDWRQAYYALPLPHFLVASNRFAEALRQVQSCETRDHLLARVLCGSAQGEIEWAIGRRSEASRLLLESRAAFGRLKRAGAPQIHRQMVGEAERALTVLESLIRIGDRQLEAEDFIAMIERVYAPQSGFDGWSERSFALARLSSLTKKGGFVDVAGQLDALRQESIATATNARHLRDSK